MKVFICFLVCLFMQPGVGRANDVLTGDTRLACEAILCLSSGVQPGECSPALSRYFGIQKKKWSNTLKARRAFLNQCPAAADPGMPNLVHTLVEAAGQCSANVLNRVLAKQIIVRECKDNPRWRRWNDEPKQICYDRTITIISDKLPDYCRAYAAHEWTWKIGVRYVGDKKNGGKWVDER